MRMGTAKIPVCHANRIDKLYKLTESASVKFLKYVFGIPDEKRAIFPEYNEEYLWTKWLDENLSEKQARIVKMHWIGKKNNWLEPEPMTLDQIASEHGLSRERMRQIISSSRFLLRKQTKWMDLFALDMTEETKTAREEIERIYNEIEKALSEREKTRMILERLNAARHKAMELEESPGKQQDIIEKIVKIEEEIACEKLAASMREKEEQIEKEKTEIDEQLDMPILDMGLSARSLNCLNRANIKTLRETIDFHQKKGLGTIRCMGKVSINEVLEKIKELYPITWIEEPGIINPPLNI